MSKKRISGVFVYDKEIQKRYTYESAKQIKKIVRNFDRLCSLAKMGVVSAICVKADIEWALEFEDTYGPYQKLSPRQFEAVYYHLILGFNQDETAAIMGMTQPAVSGYIKVAMAKLYTLLAEPPIGIQEQRWNELNDQYEQKLAGESTYFDNL